MPQFSPLCNLQWVTYSDAGDLQWYSHLQWVKQTTEADFVLSLQNELKLRFHAPSLDCNIGNKIWGSNSWSGGEDPMSSHTQGISRGTQPHTIQVGWCSFLFHFFLWSVFDAHVSTHSVTSTKCLPCDRLHGKHGRLPDDTSSRALQAQRRNPMDTPPRTAFYGKCHGT